MKVIKMTTNAEQAFWKFWQVTALSWTFLGPTGGAKNFNAPLGTAPDKNHLVLLVIDYMFKE